ncbi:MAG TPA: hypothetical protein VFY23_10495 [Candidatus Limnocylindrales bacterium]|nr:hypothetical protein [Candidatus Limnocylindrales bacterium]
MRDQIGDREDKFFATIFFGSGLLFVAMLFAAAAVAGSVVTGVRCLGLPPPTAEDTAFARTLSYTLMFGFLTRAGGVFLISLATNGLRSRTFPAWFAWIGYAMGLLMLVVVNFWDSIVLVMPAWVAVVRLLILRRERARRRRVTAAA